MTISLQKYIVSSVYGLTFGLVLMFALAFTAHAFEDLEITLDNVEGSTLATIEYREGDTFAGQVFEYDTDNLGEIYELLAEDLALSVPEIEAAVVSIESSEQIIDEPMESLPNEPFDLLLEEEPEQNDEEAEPEEIEVIIDEQEEDTFDDVFPVAATLTGSDTSEKLQGFESDDRMSGGGAPDLFVMTLGNDVITDFNPSEDMLDVGDFARESDGLATLTSLAALGESANEMDLEGARSLVIDVDGDQGDATTILLGVSFADLTESNTYFGLDGSAIPPLAFTHIADIVVTYSDGEVVLFPGHAVDENPSEDELVEEANGSSSPEETEEINLFVAIIEMLIEQLFGR